MRIIRPVEVRFVVTEELKDRLLSETRQAQQTLDSRIQQLDVEGRRVVEHIQRENVLQAGQVREQLEQEKQELLQLRRDFGRRVQELQSLELGQEIAHRTAQPVQEIVDIEVGDNVRKLLGAAEVVIKGDTIVEIRETTQGSPEEAEAAVTDAGSGGSGDQG